MRRQRLCVAVPKQYRLGLILIPWEKYVLTSFFFGGGNDYWTASKNWRFTTATYATAYILKREQTNLVSVLKKNWPDLASWPFLIASFSDIKPKCAQTREYRKIRSPDLNSISNTMVVWHIHTCTTIFIKKSLQNLWFGRYWDVSTWTYSVATGKDEIRE